ncbi:hypothetical protein, partial [Microcystis sp. M40BS1]
CKKKVFLTKSTKYDRTPTYFWLRVIIAEWGSGKVGKWGSGEVGKWGSGEVGKLSHHPITPKPSATRTQ